MYVCVYEVGQKRKWDKDVWELNRDTQREKTDITTEREKAMHVCVLKLHTKLAQHSTHTHSLSLSLSLSLPSHAYHRYDPFERCCPPSNMLPEQFPSIIAVCCCNTLLLIVAVVELLCKCNLLLKDCTTSSLLLSLWYEVEVVKKGWWCCCWWLVISELLLRCCVMYDINDGSASTW